VGLTAKQPFERFTMSLDCPKSKSRGYCKSIIILSIITQVKQSKKKAKNEKGIKPENEKNASGKP